MIEPNWIWGVVQIVLLTVLCMVGFHPFIVLGVVSSAFAFLFYGNIVSLSLIGGTIWGRVFSYEMSMIPLFILMGTWIEVAGVGKDAYDSCMKWLNQMKGSLAIVTLGAIGIFSAISGSAIASIAAIGGVALPEMKRYGYSASLRTGVVAAGSIVDALIPPSMCAVIYAILTDTSVGKLFIAGIIPGIILVFFFMFIVYGWVSLKPNIAPRLPPDVHFTWRDKFRGLTLIIPIVIIFLVLVGGIYLAWFSPTEAAGIGAFSVLVICLAFRRINWNRFNNGLSNAIKMSAMILSILAGAFIFTHTIALSRLSYSMGEWVANTGLGVFSLIYLITVIFVIAGMFLDTIALQVLLIPIFFPVVMRAAGAPPMTDIWFGVISITLVQIGLLTPPLAGALYITQMIDGCRTKDVIIGVMPFYIANLVFLVLVIQLPFLSTWLPSKMMGN